MTGPTFRPRRTMPPYPFSKTAAEGSVAPLRKKPPPFLWRLGTITLRASKAFIYRFFEFEVAERASFSVLVDSQVAADRLFPGDLGPRAGISKGGFGGSFAQTVLDRLQLDPPSGAGKTERQRVERLGEDRRRLQCFSFAYFLVRCTGHFFLPVS